MEKQSLLPEYGSVESVNVPVGGDIEHGVELHGDEVLADGYGNTTIQQRSQKIPPGPQMAVDPLISTVQPQDINAIPEVGQLLIGEAVQIDARGNAIIKRAIPWDPSKLPVAAVRTNARGNALIERAIPLDTSKLPVAGIQNGPSMDKEGISKMMMDAQRRWVLAMTIRNHSKQTLEKIHVFTKKGATRRAQQSIAQQTAEVFITLNTGRGVSTKGVASYLAKKGVYINVFWSVSIFSSKRLGIQITKQTPSAEEDFKGFNGLSVPYKENDCVVMEYKKLQPIGKVMACGLKVTCNMGNDSKTEAVIEVFDV